ncbi:molybdenum cofactor guanylyltransferase [Agromyces terreus]|uniref:molybdenum cofactor guanylyltransferase n=1 Tax=Agromyces terreus TaxID=424795 RepID=UPI0031DE3C9F
MSDAVLPPDAAPETDAAPRPDRAAPRPLDAVLLAGGRATRLDGASKPELVVGDRSLLQHAIDAARSAGARRIVVVGPAGLRAPGCLVVREDPPFGGPVAAIAAGLAARDAGPAASVVLVLACDLPSARAATARLLERRGGARDADGLCLVDADQRVQWLAAVYARAALDRAFAELPGPADGAAMRHLAAALDLVEVADDGTAADIDTWPDLERARGRADPAGRTDLTPSSTDRPHPPRSQS